MRSRTIALAVAVLLPFVAARADVAAPPQESSHEDDRFLQPYIDVLKKDTDADQLRFIRNLPSDTLWILHHDYGMWIRNKWLWADRSPKLTTFFRRRGITHPDDMSEKLIEALWRDLDRHLKPEERAAVEAKRNLTSRRAKLYETLADQCTKQLALHELDFDRCYSSLHAAGEWPPSWFTVAVAPTGKAMEIAHAPKSATNCMKAVLDGFAFASFDTDHMLHLSITRFPPHCRVKELNRLWE